MIGGTQTRWRRVETLFHRAADIDAAEREGFIERQCAGDAELRAELESLLAASDATLSDFALPAADAAQFLIHTQSEEPTRIGAYRLLRTLGEGGMGTVYLGARDDDQYQQIVAIKVLRAALSRRPELQSMFRAERQFLADFDHPNIARLLDGGITPGGSPYLVMEYIDGTAIDDFCRDRKLGLDARLRLFRMLCTAVDYAHRHLVVHRDIKPLNVLVLPDGTPKLLDFGIAKLVDPLKAHPERARITANEHLLTPDYASPEQLQGRPVSTATDVYALGVLLFELLAGGLPFPGSRAEPMAHARAVCEAEPPSPSEVCVGDNFLPAGDARRIRGDLDCMVLKCLRKEPEERYASASQLVADLDRYFDGFPLEAAGQTIPYRARKFILRHRTGAAIAALLLTLVAGFAAAMAILARRASVGEAKARREADFLTGIFLAATPEVAQGESVTARQLLDQAAGRLDNELGAQPEVQGEMTESIAESYIALGLYERAQPLLDRALRLAAKSQGQRSAAYAQALETLATDYRLQREFRKAEPMFRTALGLNEARFGPRSAQVAHSLSALGECLYWQDNDAEAETVLRRALSIPVDEAVLARDGTRNYLALTLERRGAYEEAARLLRDSTAAAAKVEGANSPDYLNSLHDLAGAQIDLGDLEGAARSDEEVLATRRRIYGADHPDTAYPLNNLGWIYLEEGRWRQAEPLLKQNLEIARKESAAPDSRYANALSNWARMLEQKGDLAGAAGALGEAMRILTANGEANGRRSEKVELYQASLDLDRRRFPDAIRLAEHAVRLERKLGSASSPQLAVDLEMLGLAELLGGNASQAEPQFREALGILQKISPAGHRDVLLAEARLAESLLAQGNAREALAIAQPALAMAKASPYRLPEWQIAELEIVDGLALSGAGRANDGEPLIRAGSRKIAEYNQPAVRQYLANLAAQGAHASAHT